jgi:hypothetical protein
MTKIEDLSVVHYCHPNCTPFFNICRLPKEEAFALAYKMAAENPETEGFYRFANTPQGFAKYYPRRLIQDEYLRNKFISLGGKPKEEHPLSFVLQGCEWLHTQYFGNGYKFEIKLSTIPSEYISFTLGDSMVMLLTKNGERVEELQPDRLVMYTQETLLNAINEYGGTLDEYMRYVAEKYKYIEVQLWNDDYCAV